MNAYKNASYVGFVLYFFALVLFAYGFVNLSEKWNLDYKGEIVQGKIMNLMVIEPYHRAEVTFTTKQGQTLHFVDVLYWNKDLDTYKKGDVVPVIYDPAAPQQSAMINGFFQRNTAPFWPMMVSFIVWVFGFVMRRIMLKKARAYE